MEFAALLPLAVLLLTAGEWMTELLAIRLKAQEAARFAAWEQTGLWTSEADGAAARYRDLDSARDREAPAALFARAQALQITIAATELSWAAPGTPLEADGGGRAANVAARARIAPLAIAAVAGLATPTVVRAEASVATELPRLGVESFHRARWSLPDVLAVRSRVAIVAETWAVEDGADSRIQDGRTGVAADGRRTGLWKRIDRMKFLGDREALAPEAGAARAVLGTLSSAIPAVGGTFVVDHALRAGRARRCEGVPGYPREALSSLRDFGAEVDPGAPRCFGTQPLRDTHKYEDSLQLHALRERGARFLGCASAEADDPSRAVDGDLGDANTVKQSCGRGR